MSFSDLLSPESQTATLPTLPYNPTGFSEVAADTFEAMTRNREPVAALRRYADDAPAFRERNDLIRERFGRDVVQEVRDEFPDIGADGLVQEYQVRTDKLIEQGRIIEPEKWQGIRTSSEIEAVPIDKAQTAQLMADATAAKAPTTTRIAGQLAGGIGAAFVDPINLATLPLGAAAGTAILRAMAVEGLLNAGIEAAEAPFTYQWQKEVGHRYGVGDVALDIGTAGVGGAALSGIIRGVAPAFRATRDITGSVSMRVLDRMASSDRLPSAVRSAAQYMSRVAHVDEEVPVRVNAPATREEIAAHREAVQETQEAIRNFRDPEYRMAELERRLDSGEAERGTALREMDTLADQAIAEKGLHRPTPVRNIDTPAFRDWFTGSHVADASGRPTVVYHGTDSDFTAFDPSKLARDVMGLYGEREGFFFTDSKDQASWYAQHYRASTDEGSQGANVLPVYLSLKNPAVAHFDSLVQQEGSKLSKVGDFIANAKRNGHDGAIIHGWDDSGGDGTQYVVFDPKQIKSIFNPGTFDPNDPRLLDAGRPLDADLATRPVNAADSLRQAAEESQASLLSDTEAADFARLLKDKPGMTLLVDGEQRTLQQIADDIAEGETIMAAIKTCGIG